MKQAKCTFACLARMIFTWRQITKVLTLRARVLVRSSNMKIARRHLAAYVRKLHHRAWPKCSTFVFLHSTNHIVNLWWCRRRFLKSRILGSLRSIDGDDNENVKTFAQTRLFCDNSFLLACYTVEKVRFQDTGRSVIAANTENKRFIVEFSCCP